MAGPSGGLDIPYYQKMHRFRKDFQHIKSQQSLYFSTAPTTSPIIDESIPVKVTNIALCSRVSLELREWGR